MKQFHFDKLLQNDGWKHNVSVQCDEDGTIQSISENKVFEDGIRILGYTVPGFQNGHSHAFQYGMAGLAEVHDLSGVRDDFWSWREAMYQLALSVSPDQIESIATMLYSEMVRQGYTNVAEFHYVHHDANGKEFGNLAEMGSRLISAAKTAGINITLVPIFYQKGGFGMEPNEGQKRFISSDIDTYYKLLESSENACKYYTGANLGIGIHSMRGVEPTDIIEVANHGPKNIPFHIHISEQLKEVDDCIKYLNKRPVEWLLDSVQLSDRFHLVHATHLTNQETLGIAKHGANVVLCPSTEGNLGDGIFPLHDYHDAGGKWSIGTDSHVGLNPLEELRLLDYGQRLTTHRRDTFASSHGDSGRFGIDMALIAGRKAMNNFNSNYFAVGQKLNAATLKADIPLLQNTSEHNILSTMLYSSDASSHDSTIVNGNLLVSNGRHVNSKEIADSFAKAIFELGNR